MAEPFNVDLKGRDHLQDKHRLWDQLTMDLTEKGLRLS